MSTMSNSPGRRLAALAVLAIAVAACATEPATDTPRERVVVAPEEPVKGGTRNAPVVLESVSVHELAASDESLREFLSEAQLEKVDRPVLLEVAVVEPFDPRPRSALPVIVLNGVPLTGSRVGPESRLRIRAVVPSRGQLRESNTVVVAWLGAEAETTSLEPLVFALDDVIE